jgi:hypothetical protein
MDAGPDIDPLHSPQDETEEFLVRLSMAYHDIDELVDRALELTFPGPLWTLPSARAPRYMAA